MRLLCEHVEAAEHVNGSARSLNSRVQPQRRQFDVLLIPRRHCTLIPASLGAHTRRPCTPSVQDLQQRPPCTSASPCAPGSAPHALAVDVVRGCVSVLAPRHGRLPAVLMLQLTVDLARGGVQCIAAVPAHTQRGARTQARGLDSCWHGACLGWRRQHPRCRGPGEQPRKCRRDAGGGSGLVCLGVRLAPPCDSGSGCAWRRCLRRVVLRLLYSTRCC